MISILAALLLMAVLTDVAHRRIPNVLVACGLLISVLFVPAMRLVQGGDGWTWMPLLGALAGLALLMPLYLIRACGAGDVKLMAMVGGFVGPAVVLQATLYTLIAGGVLSLVFMVANGVARQTLANVQFLLTDWMVRVRSGGGARLEPLAHTAVRLPYAVAIAAGTAVAVWCHGPG